MRAIPPTLKVSLSFGRSRAHDHADASHPLGLLGARRDRPCRHRAAEQRDCGVSFDHLVGTGEQREREGDAERLGSLGINDQLHLRDSQPCVLTQRQLQLLEPR